MDDKLVRKDYRFIFACVLCCVLATLFLMKYFKAAFPEASIHFKVNKSQSQAVADSFLSTLGISVNDYRHAAIFSYDDNAKTFLEKECGPEQANALMSGRVRLWRWENRWYKALQKEEFNVRVSPLGQILGFSHDIPEEAAGQSLDAETAKSIAVQFLTKHLGVNLANLDFLEQSSQQRPERMDHVFVWKDKDFNEKESTYRYQVTVQGDQIGSYAEFLHVPEKWSRDYEKLRAKNDTTGQVAALFLLLTMVAILICAVIYMRYHDIRWKTALYFGIIAAVLTFLASLNDLPITKFIYPTTESYQNFFFRNILMNFFMSLAAGFGIFLLTAAAEPIYREKYSRHLSLTRLFSWSGIRTRKFFFAIIVGLTLTFLFVAYQVAFYLIGKKYGVWAPQDIPYDNLLNTAFPWVYVLLIGFMPAVSEEFISRMFSISFFEKILKIRWLALLIPAFIWGFAHSNYPQQPFYIRGIEVSIAGIIIGFVMVKFGILATLVWHYTIDAMYTSLLLFRSGNTYFILTAAIGCGIMLLPLFVAAGAYIKNKKFLSEQALLNEQERRPHIDAQRQEEGTAQIPDYQVLPHRKIAIGLIVALCLCLSFFIKHERIGGFVKFMHSADEATLAADHFLTDMNVDIAGYKKVTFSDERFNRLAGKYALQYGDITHFNRLFSQECKSARWGVRYYKPLQKEEYLVFIDPRDLSLVSFMRTIDEDAAGSTLSQDSALALAARFAEKQGVATNDMILKDASSEIRKNRTDYSFEWEAGDKDDRNIKDMKFRVRLDIQGDRIAAFTTFPQVPENWQRERSRRSLWNTLHLVLRLLVMGTFFAFAIIRFIGQARLGHVAWKKVLLVTGILAFIFLADYGSRYKLMLQEYPTAIDIQLYYVVIVVGILISVIAMSISLALSLGLVTALYPDSVQIFAGAYRRKVACDTLWVTLIAIIGFIGIMRLNESLTSLFYKSAIIQSVGLPANIDGPLPLLSSFSATLFVAFLIATMLAVFIFVGRMILKKSLLIILAILSLIVFLPLSVRSMGEVFLAGIQLVIFVAWMLFILIYLMRENMMVYVVLPFVGSGLLYSYQYIKQGQMFLTWNAIGLVVVLAAIIVVLLMPGIRVRKS
jgi:membrane protease YdiL (CAAX protease family)